jgi:hypothetical protein
MLVMPKVTGTGFGNLIPWGQMGLDGFDELTPLSAYLAQRRFVCYLFKIGCLWSEENSLAVKPLN